MSNEDIQNNDVASNEEVHDVTSIDSPPRLIVPDNIWHFRIDRRPVACINTFGANYNQTPTGQPKWFYEPGGIQQLIDRYIEPFYAMGYRRFLQWLPAGSMRQRLMPSAQWGAQREERKAEWFEVFKPYLAAHPDIEYGVYGGFQIYDPFSLRMPETNDPNTSVRVPNLDKEADREWYRYNWGEWIKLGIRWGMMDASAPEECRNAMVQLSNMFDAFGIRLGGEAYPSERQDDGSWRLLTQMFKCPWIALHRFHVLRDPQQLWNVDTTRTEMMVLLSRHEADKYPITKETIKSYHERGFVLATFYNPDDWVSSEIMKYYV